MLLTTLSAGVRNAIPGTLYNLAVASASSLPALFGALRASGLATEVGPDGLLRYRPHNLMSHSADLSNAAWTKASALLLTGQQSADGGATAERVYAQSTGTVSVYRGTTARTLALRASAAGKRYVWIIDTVGSVVAAKFDLQLGIVDYEASGYTASIVIDANGYYWCALYANSGSAFSYAQFGIADSSGASFPCTVSGTDGVNVDGFLASAGLLTASQCQQEYIETTSAAIYLPRVTHDPVTLAPLGMLVEGQATNLSSYTGAFDNAAWVKGGGASIGPNETTGPGGSVTADRLTATGATSILYQTFAVAGTYSMQLKFKAATTQQVRIDMSLGGNGRIATFNADGSTSVVAKGTGAGASGGTASVTAVSGGWYLAKFEGLVTSIGMYAIISLPAAGSVYIDEWQFEAGNVASSYIPNPTTGSAVRPAEDYTISGSDFTTLLGSGSDKALATACRIDALGRTSGTAPGPWRMTDGTSNNCVGVYIDDAGSDAIVGTVTRAGVTTTVSLGTATAGTAFNVGVRLTSSGVHFSLNGGAPAACGSGAAPTVSQLEWGRHGSGGHLGGTIASVRVDDTVVTDAQLQAMTT